MRTGKYVTQVTGQARYKAFIPNPLPLKLRIDDELQTTLSKADMSMGGLRAFAEILPDVDFFLLMYITKEATLSSQVEGTRATFSDALKAEANIQSDEIHDDVDEILNYIRAMNYGLERLDTLPMSLRLIKEIHKELLNGVRGKGKTPGEFRKSQNWIGGIDMATASYVPPPAHEVPSLLSNLEKFMHSRAPMAPLIKAGLLHAQFETIHPFLDGNGRIGRLLVTFFLCQQGILTKPLLYLSEFFKENQEEYYQRLTAYHDKDAVEDWLRFFLTGIRISCERSIETARGVISLRERDRGKISHAGLSGGKPFALLDALYRKPILKIKDIERLVEIANPSALELTEKMVNLGILREITGKKRGRVYSYEEYISLFTAS